MTSVSDHPECPVRDHMDNKDIVWRDGKPDYTVVNKRYLSERKSRHVAGSLEKLVENLVKTWEVESSHKARAEDWKSVDKDNFYISVNGTQKFSLADNIKMGNYVMFMYDCPLFDVKQQTHHSSHELFRTALPGGFPWEMLELTSGPPVVSFTWRHWGTWEGKYKDREPTGEEFEMYGSCVVRVKDDLTIQSIEVYYDPNPTMAKLIGFDLEKACPMAQKN